MTIRSQIALLLAGVVYLLPQPASASMESCTQAHAAGQRAENAGHLKEALASFQECASDSECPLPIRNECTSLYTKVEGRLPTVVFSVVDHLGNDVTDVRVLSGDATIASSLDGRPLSVDPGKHDFRFELPNGETLTKSVVVRQGEKDRIVNLTLPRQEFAAAESGAASTEPSASAPDASDKHFKMPLGSWIAYGVGAAALVSWGTFGLVGRAKEQDLVDCSPNCTASRRDDYDTMKRDYLIADISLGVAAAGIVTGTVLLLTTGRRSRTADDATTASAPSRPLSVSPVALGRSGGGLLLEGRY
jgi:hypothetical protein